MPNINIPPGLTVFKIIKVKCASIVYTYIFCPISDTEYQTFTLNQLCSLLYRWIKMNWIAPCSKVMPEPILITYDTINNVAKGSDIPSFQMSHTADKLNTKN